MLKFLFSVFIFFLLLRAFFSLFKRTKQRSVAPPWNVWNLVMGRSQAAGMFDHLRKKLWDVLLPGSSRAFNSDLYAMVILLFWSDKVLDEDESELLKRMVVTFARSGSQREQLLIMDAMRSARSSGKPFAEYARSFARRVDKDITALDLALEFLVTAAGSGGTISSEQFSMLLEATRAFGLRDDDLKKLIKRLEFSSRTHADQRGDTRSDSNERRSETKQPPLQWAYEELDCEVGDSAQTIKKRYRSLVMRYHPDRLKAQQLPDSFLKNAAAKFLRVQSAFEALDKAGVCS